MISKGMGKRARLFIAAMLTMLIMCIAHKDAVSQICADVDGDVNADGTVNITDAVAVLSYLFLGNDPKLPQSCEVLGLPDTGQSKCYEAREEIACERQDYPGQDGQHLTGCSIENRFIDNKDGTVLDRCTGLMWQKDTADANNDQSSDVNDNIRWCQALDYCESLSFAGHSDWRLPSLRELETTIDYGRYPAMDPVFGVLDEEYWTSTFDDARYAWTIAPFTGYNLNTSDINDKLYARAVRSGYRCISKNGDVTDDGIVDISDAITILSHLFLGTPAALIAACQQGEVPGLPETGQDKCYGPQGEEVLCDSDKCPGQDAAYTTGCYIVNRFVDNKDGTVLDRCTGLMWQKNTADVNNDGSSDDNDSVTWRVALGYSSSLTLAGYSDWRLPNVRELNSIVAYGLNPALDPVLALPLTDESVISYWSSTTRSEITSSAWYVQVNSGLYGTNGKIVKYFVRAVR